MSKRLTSAQQDFQQFVLESIREYPGEKAPFPELCKRYDEKTGKKKSKQAYHKKLLKIKHLLNMERKEQLWLSISPNVPQEVNQPRESQPKEEGQSQPKQSIAKLAQPQSQPSQPKSKQKNLIHSSHRWRFTINYKGSQPLEGGKITRFGRYKTATMATYEYENLTIIAYKNKLNVWIHKPTGQLTEHQAIEARTRGYMALKAFERQAGIHLIGDLKKILNSHHVAEHEPYNELMKAIIKGREEEIEERLGMKVCETSHPGKVEITGTEQLSAEGITRNLEYLVTRFPSQFAQLTEANMDFRENQVSHVAAIKELTGMAQEIRGLVKIVKDHFTGGK